MGYFLNPVALRTQLSSSMTFRQLVQRVRSTVVGAQANSEARTRLSQQAACKHALSWVVTMWVDWSLRSCPAPLVSTSLKTDVDVASWHAGPASDCTGVCGF